VVTMPARKPRRSAATLLPRCPICGRYYRPVRAKQRCCGRRRCRYLLWRRDARSGVAHTCNHCGLKHAWSPRMEGA
jgi:hypothetical protein